jgi:hypothetical protein
VASEASPVTARAFDPDGLDRSKTLGPGQQPLIPRPRCGELDLTKSSPELIERHRHMRIPVRIDADGHPGRLELCNPRHCPSPS